jgi:hypothetical protein
MAERARRNQHDFAAAKFEEKSRQAEKQAALIRDMLLDPKPRASPPGLNRLRGKRGRSLDLSKEKFL